MLENNANSNVFFQHNIQKSRNIRSSFIINTFCSIPVYYARACLG